MKLAYHSKTLTDSAKDQPCMHCGSTGTTVAAHVNSVALGKGTGCKPPDFYTAWLCMRCHAVYDGRMGNLSKADKEELWIRAYLKTVAEWFRQGIVRVA